MINGHRIRLIQLDHIIYNGLNMNKIESRPIEGNVEGKRWNFRFFVDFAGNIDDPRVMNALRGIDRVERPPDDLRAFRNEKTFLWFIIMK